jgi:hypothetical protein
MPANTVKILDAVEVFSNWMANEASEEWKRAAIVALRQKNLACLCKLGTPCHGDYLLTWIENAFDPSGRR